MLVKYKTISKEVEFFLTDIRITLVFSYVQLKTVKVKNYGRQNAKEL